MGKLGVRAAALWTAPAEGYHQSTVPPLWLQVLEAASAGNFNARPLRFGEPLSDRVDKSGCHYYLLELAQRHLDSGFVVGAHSSAGSKFKLLMFERTSDGQWDLVLQEDSMKVQHFTPPHQHASLTIAVIFYCLCKCTNAACCYMLCDAQCNCCLYIYHERFSLMYN